MEKLTPQIAALYLGQECLCKYRDDVGRVEEITRGGEVVVGYNDNYDPFFVCTPPEIKPILRPLSSLTEAEAREVYFCDTGKAYKGSNCFNDWFGKWHLLPTIELQEVSLTPLATIKLLSWGIDLFALIESGLAVDATKLETEKRFQ